MTGGGGHTAQRNGVKFHRGVLFLRDAENRCRRKNSFNNSILQMR